jgi:hypothetical protein
MLLVNRQSNLLTPDSSVVLRTLLALDPCHHIVLGTLDHQHCLALGPTSIQVYLVELELQGFLRILLLALGAPLAGLPPAILVHILRLGLLIHLILVPFLPPLLPLVGSTLCELHLWLVHALRVIVA